MIKPVSIDKDTVQEPSMDFDFLRRSGIELIQQLAGESWTDFNLHDPGVTILEQLCYAITELAYRTDFPIKDLLADQNGDIDYPANAFFLKEEILTCNPVTINDYRKVIIDEVESVKNVWLYPITSAYSSGALSGLYKVVVQVNPQTADKLLSDSDLSIAIIEEVRRCFVSKRNLCEDIIDDIILLKPIKVSIEAEIMIESHLRAEEVLAYVYHELENKLNRPVRYYTEAELLDRGLSVDELYDGPFLKNGFIPDSELRDRKTVIDPAELIKSISQVEGVLSVKNLRVRNGQSENQNKPLNIPENSFALLDIKSSEQLIKLFKDNFEIAIKRPIFRSILQKVRESDTRNFISSFYSTSKQELIKGKNRHNEIYHSIQNQFPKVYGIGSEGLPLDTPKSRKAQAKQLKAYLLLFEQVMANYLGQLSNINEAFSIDFNKTGANTYFINPLYNVPDIKYLLKAFTSKHPELSEQEWEIFKSKEHNSYISSLNDFIETDQIFDERKNRLFDHLLARFNEFVTPYPVQLYCSLYESHLNDRRISTELKWKSTVLKRIPKLGSDRIKAFNYLDPHKHADNQGFAAKMRLLLYISEDNVGKMLSSVLDSENVSRENTETKALFQTEVNKAKQLDEISWLGDMPQILIDQKEISELIDTGMVINNDNVPNDAFLLQKQEINVLKYALDIRNFRIGPNPEKDSAYVIIYKSPDQKKWTIISHFANHSDAMKSLKNLISYIKKINIKSEGFYLLEHILIRPELDSKVFGFRFIARNGQKLMEHSRWMTFSERDEVMGSLLEILTGTDEVNAEKLEHLCKINLYASLSDLPEVDLNNQTEQEGKSLYNYFKIYASQKKKFLARFEMVVKGDDNQMITEDFFRLNMSVVFPSWPARFQDKNFRQAAENLFRLNAPAHVKINFIWMGLSKLKRFEAWYYDWKRFMSENIDQETRNVLRNALVHMLYQQK